MTLAVYLGVTQPIKQTRYRPTGILSTMRVRPSHFLGLCHLRGDSRCGDKINSSPSEHGPLIKIRQFPTAELFVHPLDDVVQHFINFHELSSSVRLTVALWPESCTRRLEIKINYYSPTVRSLLQGMGETVVDQGGGRQEGSSPPLPCWTMLFLNSIVRASRLSDYLAPLNPLPHPPLKYFWIPHGKSGDAYFNHCNAPRENYLICVGSDVFYKE